jgi:hypothetical protein
VEDEFDRFIADTVKQFFNKIRRWLAIARFLNSLFYMAAAAVVLLMAGYLVSISNDVPALYVAAFLVAWTGLRFSIAGLEEIASMEPAHSVETLPVLLDDQYLCEGIVRIHPGNPGSRDIHSL